MHVSPKVTPRAGSDLNKANTSPPQPALARLSSVGNQASTTIERQASAMRRDSVGTRPQSPVAATVVDVTNLRDNSQTFRSQTPSMYSRQENEGDYRTGDSFDKFGTNTDLREGPERARSAPDILEAIKDEKPNPEPINWRQTGEAALGALVRDGVSAGAGAAVKVATGALLNKYFNPVNTVLTAGGVFFGGGSGAYLGAGLAAAAVKQSRYADNPYVKYLAIAACGATGFVYGALPSILNCEPLNTAAINQISSSFGALTRDVSQQAILKEVGSRIERTATFDSACANVGIYSLERAAGAVLVDNFPEWLPPELKIIFETALVEGGDGVSGTILRASYKDAKRIEGKYKPVIPKAIELVNATLLRNVGTTTTELLKSAVEIPIKEYLKEGPAASAVSAAAGGVTASRPYVATLVIEGINGPTASYSPDPGTAPAPNIDGIVAGANDANDEIGPIRIKFGSTNDVTKGPDS